jgi:hypothetical protein
VVVADLDEEAGLGTVREIGSEGGRLSSSPTLPPKPTRLAWSASPNAGGVEEPYFPEGSLRIGDAQSTSTSVARCSACTSACGPYDKPEHGAAKAGVVRLIASLAT